MNDAVTCQRLAVPRSARPRRRATALFLPALFLPALILTALCATLCSPAAAQRLSDRNYKNGSEVKGAFKDIVKRAHQSTMLVRCAGKPTALATIVDAQGLLLTKASDLKAPIECQIDKQIYPATIIGIHKPTDLAMLKIDAKGLKPVEWAKTDQKIPVGRWVISAGLKELPLAVGNVSVPRRKIDREHGVLGILLDPRSNIPKIVRVFLNSGAAKAGLKVGDVISQVDTQMIRTREALILTIRKYRPGDVVRLAVTRGDEALDVEATLSTAAVFMPGSRRRSASKLLTGALSRRRDDFPAVFTHDSVLKPTECGGPLVDLSGKVVGINIARAGRTASYALPTQTIIALLDDLKSGKLAPVKDEPKADDEPKKDDRKKSDSPKPKDDKQADKKQDDKQTGKKQTGKKQDDKKQDDKADSEKKKDGEKDDTKKKGSSD